MASQSHPKFCTFDGPVTAGLHPAFDAVEDMENEICRAEGLGRALYELIGEKVPENDRDKHRAMFTVCSALMETIERLNEKWNKAFDATKRLTQ